MWVVDKSYIDNEDGCMDGKSYKPVVIMGPDGWHPGDKEIYHFQMFDDDDNLYYEGYSDRESFTPLDDFGMPNAGCTTIKYKHGNEWVIL